MKIKLCDFKLIINKIQFILEVYRLIGQPINRPIIGRFADYRYRPIT